MPVGSRRASALREIASGKTLAQAAEALGIGTTRVRQLLNHACRDLGLPSEVSYIQSNGKMYLARIERPEVQAVAELRPALQQKLMDCLDLKSELSLTPKYLSNLSASQLLASGLTIIAIAEIQEWMRIHKTSLRHSPLKERNELRNLAQAVFLLDAYHFDVSAAKEQLNAEREAGEGAA